MMPVQAHPATGSGGNDWGASHYIQTLVRLATLVLGIYLCYRLAVPFLSALVWAVALAVVLAPMQRWGEAKIKCPGLVAGLSVLVIGVIVLGLASFMGHQLIREITHGAELVTSKVESGEWRHALESHPRLEPLAAWLERQNLPGTIKAGTVWMTTTGASFVKGSVVEVVMLLLTFYLLFFFLRDRHTVLRALRSLSPFSGEEMDLLCGRIGDTVFAVIYGTGVGAVAQGLLGGLMFWFLGLPAPLLWGVMMALLSLMPVLGAFVIWIPAAVFLALAGSWGKAVVLAVWGVTVIGTIDNLLCPLLVGNRLKRHTVLVFISIVGGLIVFGVSGLILGPVVITTTTGMLEIWCRRTAAGQREQAMGVGAGA